MMNKKLRKKADELKSLDVEMTYVLSKYYGWDGKAYDFDKIPKFSVKGQLLAAEAGYYKFVQEANVITEGLLKKAEERLQKASKVKTKIIATINEINGNQIVATINAPQKQNKKYAKRLEELEQLKKDIESLEELETKFTAHLDEEKYFLENGIFPESKLERLKQLKYEYDFYDNHFEGEND